MNLADNQSEPEWYVSCLAQKEGLFKFLDLCTALNALIGLEKKSKSPRDLAESRNYRLFEELTGPKMLHARISSSFKPPEFIHPFEKHYSLPGYLDLIVLPYIADTVDAGAGRLFTDATADSRSRAQFLAFVYMTFLLVHPFVDRNGRVARGLLDYYYNRISCRGPRPWLAKHPKFSTRHEHADAFNTFFKVAGLPELQRQDPYPIPDWVRLSLRSMADHLIEWAVAFRDERHAETRSYHEMMTDLIATEPRRAI